MRGTVSATSPHLEVVPTVMDEGEKYILEQKKKAMRELLARECIGRYKIELMFAHNRSYIKPTVGMLSIWESGTKLHGGGDAVVYFCAGKEKKVSDCDYPIPFDNCNYGHLLCPKCGKVWKGTDVHQHICGRWSLQTWAEKLVRYYAYLGQDADIYLKQPRSDIRTVAGLEQERQHKGDKLIVARTGLIRYIYPLARIVKDTSNGSDLYAKFYAFLKA